MGWIRSGDSVLVNKSCKAPLSIVIRHKDVDLCDIVEMDATHLLFGRHWQFNVDPIHKGRTNQYNIKVDDTKMARMPLSPKDTNKSENPTS